MPDKQTHSLAQVHAVVVVALACAAGCNSFTADPPASTSDAGADAAADGPPPVVGGNPVPDDCDRPTVAYDWDTKTPQIGVDATGNGSPPARMEEGPPHRGFARFLASGATLSPAQLTTKGRRLCFRFAVRYATRAAADRYPFQVGSAFVGSTSVQVKVSTRAIVFQTSPQNVVAPADPSRDDAPGTWHVVSLVFEPTPATGLVGVTIGVDGKILERTSPVPNAASGIEGGNFSVGSSPPFSAPAGNDGSDVDIDDVRIRVDP